MRTGKGMIPSVSMCQLLKWIPRENEECQGVVVVDIRPQAEYNGWSSGGLRSGHIPSSRNLPYEWVLDNELKIKCSLSELENILYDKKITRDKTVVVYGSTQLGGQWDAIMELMSTQLSYPCIYSYRPGIEQWGDTQSSLPMECLVSPIF